jgi:sugar/nucleoside kinase (ribokinase family)
MRTCMGAALGLSTINLPMKPLSSCDLLHCEGYTLYKPDVLKKAIAAAKAGGAKVSLDLASFEVIRQCQASLLEVLGSGGVDIVFCNEDESHELNSLIQSQSSEGVASYASRPCCTLTS